ncbi:MAG: DUF4102 domain-containing protein [Paraburkholderia sp.]|nr:MAG: DUF4102 domain-containing protein [Paraburkholderia sp.]TAM29091.1 MAG: DUF4102 domain-containing protein [Paraburkholderia sp.]
MPLTNVQLKQARPGSRPLKLFDGGGLFLLITPAGQRYWRLKYRFAGKEKLLALGVYPEVTLLKARKLREEAREKLASNVDPGETRREVKRQILLAAANSFEDVAREWASVWKGTPRSTGIASGIVSKPISFPGWESARSTRSRRLRFSNVCVVSRHVEQLKPLDAFDGRAARCFDTPLPQVWRKTTLRRF